MTLAYHYLRHGRGRVEWIPLFRRIAPLWDSSAERVRRSWYPERMLIRSSAGPRTGAELDPLLEDNLMHQFDATEVNDVIAEAPALITPDRLRDPADRAMVVSTGWLAVPGGGDRRQYRIHSLPASVECEMREWRRGCRPGAWEYLGVTFGGLEHAIRRARDLQHLTDAYLSLCESVLTRNSVG